MKISKKYKTENMIQTALNEISLNFRDNEFVSILGPVVQVKLHYLI